MKKLITLAVLFLFAISLTVSCTPTEIVDESTPQQTTIEDGEIDDDDI